MGSKLYPHSCLIFSLKMPCFILFTNLPKSSIPEGFLLETSEVISQAIGKPEDFITVRIHPDQLMIHGRTNEPCANSELQCVGKLGLEPNKKISKQIAEFLQTNLGIHPSRNYIKFTDMPRSEVGLDGTTIAYM